jgi:two-component system response regulator
VTTTTRRGAAILLVEDNRDDVELTLRALCAKGMSVDIVVATNGHEALDYLFCRGAHEGRAPGDNPCVVLLDLKMPGLGGLEVLARLRADARTSLLPVVILTSSREERDVSASYELGANSYVRKPVDFESFREAMRQIGAYWLGLNEAPPAPI